MNENTKPCIVQTAQGFTISYKQKFLYSKYSPDKAINQYIQTLNIQPQTLILCISPVLNYGLKELSQKLPPDCIMLGCEYEPDLYDFIIQNNQDEFKEINNYSLLTRDELLDLGQLLTRRNITLQSGFTLPQPGTFRRIIKIDFSAGAQFNAQLYESLLENTTNAIMTFWANRVTLVKFGRKYSTNFFKNLSFSQNTVPIQKYFGSISKPILVFGAGESALNGIKMLKQLAADGKDYHKEYFIICADTALQPLISMDIIPDGVFIEEAQSIISKCFIGTQNKDIHIFAGLSSLHSITNIFKPEQISFFTTEYTQANFIQRLQELGILPPKNMPFGSVGVTAYYYATVFRKDESIPIQTYGLDFSYSAGRTHVKGAMADNTRFQNSNRIKPDANYAAAFNEPAFKISEKMYSTPIMDRYAQLMKALRETQGQQIQKKDCRGKPVETTNKIAQTLKQEASSLQELKSLLTGETKLPADQQEAKITQLIKEREYLYLHFPDGQKFQYTQSFLNRVRVEIEYFLKILNV